MAITVSTPNILYFAGNPISLTISTNNSSVDRFKIELLDSSDVQIGNDIITPFFNQTIDIDIAKLIDAHLSSEEGVRMPTGDILEPYTTQSFKIKATELIAGAEQVGPVTTASFRVLRGKLPNHIFDSSVSSHTHFDYTSSFLSNYPNPENIYQDEIKYITFFNTYDAVIVDVKLVAEFAWGSGPSDRVREIITMPEQYNIVQIAFSPDSLSVPDSATELTLKLIAEHQPAPPAVEDFTPLDISETLTFKIQETYPNNNYDILYFNHYNQPTSFRLVDAWTVVNKATRNNFRDFNNYRQARTKEAFKSYSGKRPLLRQNEVEALSELKTANVAYIWESNAWRQIKINTKKWTEKVQYKYLYNVEINFDKSQNYI